MKINSSEHRRVFFLFIALFLWVLFICSSLVKIQVIDYNKNVAKVRAQSNFIFPMNARRGTIYDSKGEVLAISVKVKSAFLNNKEDPQSLALFKDIKKQITLTAWEKANIEDRIRRGEKFTWIKRKLSPEEYESLKKIKDSNKSNSILDFVEEYKRVYPQNTSACHMLGGVGLDEQGLYGLEYELDAALRGTPGKARVMRDARRKAFKLSYLNEPLPGRDVYLTIDSSIQFFVERELQKTVEQYGARGGTVIVMDAEDGAILAIAGYPAFSPEEVKNTPALMLKNSAVSFLYHPGSTFKVVLAAIALEENVCSPQYEFNCCNGVYKIMDRQITDVHPFSRLSFENIIIQSSNIGAAKIAERLGKTRYYNGIKKFGFGEQTGIGLPGEEKGIFKPVKQWTGVSLQFIAGGYEIAVTPLQMARAFNVIASGGYLAEPYILKEVDGIFSKPKPGVKILGPVTTQRMTNIMTEVVNSGTARKTQIAGINIAGKTGTTKIIGKDKQYVSSFGGFFPAESPRVTVFVVIDDPKGDYYGGDVAAPLFKSIAEKLLLYLKIFPQLDKKNEIRI
ncbi:MAG: penicillin-binding protein 2 [Candidatus Aminicenantes bacterium]|nr:penicillin-binding protein 2 [Candidatus Aminicenantes bacterium]